MSFTVNITRFLADECMRDYSASMAELGQNAGRDTWRACTENAPAWNFIPPDQFEYFRDWVENCGAWTREEIDAWTDDYLQALCLQWIAADARDCGADKPGADWEAIRAAQESGAVSSSIYRADDGSIYWECNQ